MFMLLMLVMKFVIVAVVATVSASAAANLPLFGVNEVAGFLLLILLLLLFLPVKLNKSMKTQDLTR